MKFVSMATQDYTPGVLTLIKSMEKNANLDFEFKIIQIGEYEKETKQKFQELETKIEFFKAEDLGNFEFDNDLLNTNRSTHQNKFLIYKLPFNEKMCYIDSDMICLDDISHLEKCKPFTACPNIGREDPETVYERPMFNAGLMVFQPSEERFQELQNFALEYDKEMNYGDQRLFNEFYYKNYPEEVNLLGFNWNVFITVKKYRPKLWKHVNQTGIKFLHFTNIKPWIYSQGWKKFTSRKEHSYNKSIPNKIYKKAIYNQEIKKWKQINNQV